MSRAAAPLVVLVLLAACRSGQRDAADVTVTDDLGREVHVSRTIDRVVTLAPNITEIVFAAGAGHMVVGVTTADDHPKDVERLPRFSAWPLNFEAILALEPDLVLASGQVTNPGDAAVLSSMGLPTYFVEATDLESLLRSIRRTGELLSTQAAAARAADSLAASIAELRRRTGAVTRRPSTLFLVGDETLYAFGKGSHVHDVIYLAGGTSATASFAARAPVLSEEFVLLARPDVIVGSTREQLLVLHPSWDIVPAVADDRVYALDEDVFVRPGPRLVQGAWRLAASIHPDLFPDAR